METWILWKIVKWYELCETLELRWIGLWNVCIYTTALICDLCIYLVEVFDFVWFVLSDNLENERNDTNLKIWSNCWLLPMKRIVHTTTLICDLCVYSVEAFFLWWSGFEPQTLHILCIVPTDWAKLTMTRLRRLDSFTLDL